MKLASIVALLALSTGVMGQHFFPPNADANVISCEYTPDTTTAILEVGDVQYQVQHSGGVDGARQFHLQNNPGNQCRDLRLVVGRSIKVLVTDGGPPFEPDKWQPVTIAIPRKQSVPGLGWIDFSITDRWTVK